ncbi:hypothetical protein CBW24_07805 [Pacificitalea manganoxidans]|uniref:Uncharacterized protein n=1 Tax=Pacificitalea manganoxidans TaxID=1411902 RepID=A0A291LZ28_9RHOB|nr:hypothetical protein [Pacificitalea manganoxidans]ATI41914.1 hypothetical protein CBW24_07805 [Pacificitalea manganoxidans]MDR6309400.1 hypothetical protein [Pacificitalea manganoxidans]
MTLGIKEPLVRAAVVLFPSYGAAYLTGQMVYVVPTLAAAGILASSITFERQTSRRVDEDDDGDGEELDPEAQSSPLTSVEGDDQA